MFGRVRDRSGDEHRQRFVAATWHGILDNMEDYHVDVRAWFQDMWQNHAPVPDDRVYEVCPRCDGIRHSSASPESLPEVGTNFCLDGRRKQAKGLECASGNSVPEFEELELIDIVG